MKIAFLGDMAFFGKYDLNNNPNVLDYFSEAKKVLDTCDYRVGNLEAPFVLDGTKVGNKSAYISTQLNNVEILNYLNINAVCLANNHIFDFGSNGYRSTIATLENNNIEWFGAKSKDLILEKDKIVFHGYCSYNTNPVGIKNKNFSEGISALIYDDVILKMREYKKLGLFNVLSIHSGIEHVNIPSQEDLNFARQLSKDFDYLYYGHHPHVVQGVEEFNNSLLAYSLGNFCFDDLYDERTGNILIKQSKNNNASFVLIVEIQNNIIISHERIYFSHSNDRLILNSEVSKDYSIKADEFLLLEKNHYLTTRNEQVKISIINRDSKRDLYWFLYRLKPSTLLRLIERKINAYKYKKYFFTKVDKL